MADLIDASTEAAARSASRSLSGGFSKQIRLLLEQLTALRTLVEATLDFPEEEIDFLEQSDARGRLDGVAAQLAKVLDGAKQGALLREGIKVVIAGQPNVGKSSLLNALAGAELAIVTAVPGTTRDKVSQTIQIEGVPVHVVDTAGLRDTDDQVERIGIARSWDEITGADALLFLRDLTRIDSAEHRAADAAIAARLPAALQADGRLLHVFNKRDAAPSAMLPDGALAISARTGTGLEVLRRKLLALAGWHANPEGVFIARARHVDALRRTQAHVQRAIDHAAQAAAALDLLAEELRLAQRALGEVTGEFTADDLLGEIFGRFCIGK